MHKLCKSKTEGDEAGNVRLILRVVFLTSNYGWFNDTITWALKS